MKPTILIFEIILLKTTPPVWRIIEVKQNTTLHELHAVIQVTMGWENCHLYSFTRSLEEHHIEIILPEYHPTKELFTGNSPKEFKLRDIFRNVDDCIFYTYDFGDNWRHRIIFRGRKFETSPFGYPAVVAGARCCPPEDVGGVHGYAELLEVIETRNKKSLKEFDNWMGYRYNPDAFGIERFMSGIRRSVKKVVDGFSLEW